MDVDTNPDCFDCDYRNHNVLHCAAHSTIVKINEEKGYNLFKKGTHILEAGKPANGFFFIKKGLVRCFAQLPSGKEQTFCLRGPGDWLGFRDCISQSSFHHNAIAVEDTDACYLTRELVETLVQEDPSFQKDVFRQMAKEWRESEEQIVSLGTKQVHEKLAEIIIVLDNAQGSRNRVDLKITRDVLASFIGIQTETLVRALADLKARDYISVEKNKIDILNKDALRSLSKIA
ncbi:Crp/Fnr family transcriptional regulator [Leptospira idonii]|uniref:Crp/Fnr family transcriptional regulator n=1 Tax=Leptospira idonii TaxID=1193500 RepID=A0A4R9M449_9LEPT|nr:Crp/Fnr family transcriptional regulator [Leptospira idonii]TGN20751.1 Crp/Fnr family transcriptional regulator [Leptospira idonii]